MPGVQRLILDGLKFGNIFMSYYQIKLLQDVPGEVQVRHEGGAQETTGLSLFDMVVISQRLDLILEVSSNVNDSVKMSMYEVMRLIEANIEIFLRISYSYLSRRPTKPEILYSSDPFISLTVYCPI